MSLVDLADELVDELNKQKTGQLQSDKRQSTAVHIVRFTEQPQRQKSSVTTLDLNKIFGDGKQ